MNHATWPARSAICLDCRTALPAGMACPHGVHQVASLREPAGREALLYRVWGSRTLRMRLLEAGRVGAVGSGSASLLNGCPGCEFAGVDGDVLLVLAVAFVVIAGGWLLVRWITDAIRRWQQRRRFHARGARAALPAPRATGCIGTIAATAALAAAPLEGEPCVAFGARLIYEHQLRRWGPQTMLIDGATLGFEVALDSGARARIPAGPCVLEADVERSPPAELAAYLRAIDPRHGDPGDLDPFPCDRVELAMLGPGDRVEILSPVRTIADGAFAAGYRETAAIVVPDGPVRLRRVTATTSCA